MLRLIGTVLLSTHKIWVAGAKWICYKARLGYFYIYLLVLKYTKTKVEKLEN